ncbi:hypothetical protein REC12_13730 [Desulfosporosinus sp. PR]|uniref:hypothetical protein n=1 Tax=Candidatus Desulfosporosinus nitrosoreducens TaxID=3401928 RepID=UPI0027EBF44D|nr:hypothetical protein [Desulfosporosinus sp. PR]MDQ7094652.1 hypothetical protein [Desulfosporosinus sp. PR]
MNTIITIAAGIFVVLVMIWVIWRQMSTRIVLKKPTLWLGIMIVGIVVAAMHISKGIVFWSIGDIIFLIMAYPVSAVLFAVLRAKSYRLWVGNDGLVMRKGTAITLILWVISVAIHAWGNYIVPGSEILMAFYMGLTLLIQRKLVFNRAKQKYPNEIKANLAIEAKKNERR